MVDFRLAPEEQRVLDELDVFLDNEVMPAQEKLQDYFDHDGLGIQPDGTLHPEIQRASRELRRKSGKAGFLALHIPKEGGGLGLSYNAYLQAIKRVYTRGLGLTFNVVGAIEGPNRMLLALDDAHRERWLKPLVEGEKTTCVALTEWGVGSDLRNMETTAVKDGDEWVIDGTKTFITNGPYADFVQVLARTGREGGLGDYTAFVVETGTPGFRRGETLETIANNGLPCELIFEGCRVPEENVIGGVGEGFYHALQNINELRIMNGGLSLGLAQFCLDRTLGYLTTRQAFGKPISNTRA